MNKILVTGATGFLGGYVIKLLEQKGYTLIAFGRNEKVGKTLISDKTSFYKGNLKNIEDIENASSGCDCIIHAGALSTVWGDWKDFYESNVLSTKNIMTICQKNNIKRLVFISSPSIYTSNQDKYDIKEVSFDKKNQLNNYIKSKIMAEELIRDFQHKNFSTVILRPRGLFGIGDTSIIPRLLKANDNIGIPLFNNGKNIVDITYVENVAHAVYLSIITPNIDGEIFNITNGEPMAFKNILELLLDKIEKKPKYLKLNFKFVYKLVVIMEKIFTMFRIKKEPIFTKYTIITLGFSQTLNIDKARQLLGYKPVHSISKGIEIYAKWYKEQNFID